MQPRSIGCAARMAVCTTAQTIVRPWRMLGLGGAADGLAPVYTRGLKTRKREGEIAMLYTIAVILLIAWLLGIVGTYTIGAFVHVLLVIAIVLFLVGMVTGRRTLA